MTLKKYNKHAFNENLIRLSDSSDGHIKTVDDTVEQLVAPVEDPLEFDDHCDHCLLDTFSEEQNAPFPSEDKEEGMLLEQCADTATTAENDENRIKTQEQQRKKEKRVRRSLNRYVKKMSLLQNGPKHQDTQNKTQTVIHTGE